MNQGRRDRRQLTLGMVVAAGVHAGLLALAARPRPQGPPPAPIAVALSRVAWHPPPPPEPPPSKPAPRARAGPRAVHAAAPAQPLAVPPPLVLPASEPGPGPVVDFTGVVSVTGAGTLPSGGGAGPTGATPAAGQPTGAADGTRAVALDERSWSCPWPREADTDQIDEQTVVIRVLVDSDGRTQSVEIVTDPGHGFGAAARACALHVRFTPARDIQGHPVRALSPPIAVRFVR